MKRIIYLLTPAIILVMFSFTLLKKGEDLKPLAIGSKAPKANLEMKDISGKMMSLDDIKKKKGLLVIFSCNTCPFVMRWEDVYPELGKLCKHQDIGMVLVNSNAALRDEADSFEAMKEHAEEKGYNTSYVVDKNSVLANAFGAKTTPHVFLFNGEMKLAYEGSIDDRYENDGIVSKRYLEQAIEYMIAGKEIPLQNTKAIGCSIKRVKK